MAGCSEKCSLLTPRSTNKNKRRSSSPSSSSCSQDGLFQRNLNNYRFQPDFCPISSIPSAAYSANATVRDDERATASNVPASFVNHRRHSVAPQQPTKLNRLHSCRVRRFDSPRNSSQVLLNELLRTRSDTCRSLKTSASSPYGFATATTDSNSSRSPWNPLIAMLERSGIITSRKLSFDSASSSVAIDARSSHADAGLCSVTLTGPSPAHSRYQPNAFLNPSTSIKMTKTAPAANTATASAGMNHSPSHHRIPGTASPVPDQRNPLYEVSNEYMRVAGYVQQFNRLFSIKAPKQGETQSESGKGDESKTDAEGNKEKMANGERPDISKPRGTVYGRLWKDQPNMKRFKYRKRLLEQRTKACNFTLFFALAGIGLTILEAELIANKRFEKTDLTSKLLRYAILVSTLILLGFIVWYHAIEVKVCVIDSGAHDWRVAITGDRVLQLCIELLVCSVCPFPNSIMINWIVLLDDHRQIRTVQVPLDVVLSIPMFSRCYLICRFMALHSRQFQDAATRSIASLNRVTVNFTFVLKTQMHEHPLMVLCGFTVSFWIVMAWILTQCERFDAVLEDYHYLNALWFIMITFKSVGYGDLVPNTYCGRVIAITTGIVGAAVSSALIAVIGMKLELSRAEKHVNNFMADSKLTRLRKDTAAAVLQHTWFIHKYRRIQTTRDEIKLRFHQRKFLAAINEFRKVKWDQRKLAEQGNALVDLAKLQNDMHTMIWTMQQTLDHLSAQMAILTQNFNQLQEIGVGVINRDESLKQIHVNQ